MLVDLLRLLALLSAAMFVLITITNSFLELPPAGHFLLHGILAVGEFRLRASPKVPYWPFVAANRQRRYDTTFV
jgi:hypothetical protein